MSINKEIIFGDIKNDVLCLFLLFKFNKLLRTDIAGILGYSTGYVKKKIKPLVDKNILKEEYDKHGYVIYIPNQHMLNALSNELIKYCKEREKILKSKVDEYISNRGLLSTYPSHAPEPRVKTDLKRKTKSESPWHIKAKEVLIELGKILNFQAEPEYYSGKCRDKFDTVWKKAGTLKKVFEIVYSEERLEKALSNLLCAKKGHNATPYLIVFKETNYRRALDKLNTPTYEDIKHIAVIRGEKLIELYDNELIRIIGLLTRKD